MPKKNILWTDFMAGELSPRMEMRDDLEGRKHGVEFLENWTITPQGTIQTAPGTEYVLSVPGSFGRVFAFPITLFTGFIIIVTPDKVYVSDLQELHPVSNLVANGGFSLGDSDWDYGSDPTASVVFIDGAAVIQGGSAANKEAWIQQDVTVVANEKHELRIQLSSGDGDMMVNVGTTQGGTDIHSEVYSTPNDITIPDLETTGTTMWIECRVAGPDYPEKIVNTLTLLNTDNPVGTVEFVSPWTSVSEIAFIQAEFVPSTTTLRFVSDEAPPQDLSYDIATDTWTFAPTSITSAPSEWVAGSYPAAICFFEGRMYLGGSRDNPNRFWASKSGNFEDFTIGTLADDAFSHDLSKRGRIRSMSGAQNLVICTENTEFIATSQDGVIIPGDIKTTVQTTYGSFRTNAVEVGNDLLYISPDGRKIRRMGYEWSKDAWQNQDITFGSEHITEDGAYLTQLHYAPNPDNIIASVNGKNTLTMMSYEPASATAGFMRRTTQGIFHSICVLPIGGTDEMWTLTSRTEGQLYLERLPLDHRAKLDSHYHMAVNGSGPITELYVPHLADLECDITVDGAVHPSVTPATGTGYIELEFAAEREIVVGLAYTSTLITMPISDSINPVGTTRPMKKRWVKAFVRILNSYRPTINGVRPPDRLVPTPMGQVEDPQTESVPVSVVGWDYDAKLTITQDLPLFTEIAGIFGQVDQKEI